MKWINIKDQMPNIHENVLMVDEEKIFTMAILNYLLMELGTGLMIVMMGLLLLIGCQYHRHQKKRRKVDGCNYG